MENMKLEYYKALLKAKIKFIEDYEKEAPDNFSYIFRLGWNRGFTSGNCYDEDVFIPTGNNLTEKE